MANELTQQEIDRQIDNAIANSAKANQSSMSAKDVIYDRKSRKIVIYFHNRCQFECPIDLLQGVCELADDEIAQVELTPAGWGLTWSKADLDFGINELVRGIFGTKAWMEKIVTKNAS